MGASSSSDGGPDIGKHLALQFDEFESRWIPHPDDSIDLCVMPIAPILRRGKEDGKAFFCVSLDGSLMPSQSEVDGLTQLEEIVMVGYPIGIWDETNNMPIFRQEVTATHPRLDWNGRPEFLIDAACFPGSSGSPVFLLNQASYPSRGGTVIGSRIKFLGVLYAGPQFTVEGNVTVVSVPTQQKAVALSNIPTNLGIVTKAKNLD